MHYQIPTRRIVAQCLYFPILVPRIQKHPTMEQHFQNFLYNSFFKEWLRWEGRELSVGHNICLLVSSVTHDLHKQYGHSSVMLFCSILNVRSNSSVSCSMSSISPISQLLFNKSQISAQDLSAITLLLPPSAILWVSEWISCLTSQLTIFQSYMWRHIDVQADWRRSWTYGRAPTP